MNKIQKIRAYPPKKTGDIIPGDKKCINSKKRADLEKYIEQLKIQISELKKNLEINEIRETKYQIEQTKKDLQLAQEVAKTGSWRLDTKENILNWSSENYIIFGIPEGTPLTYQTFLSTVHPQDRAYVDKKWKAALKGKEYDIEHRIIANGKVKWVREKAVIEQDHNGVAGGFGITQDITELKEAIIEVENLARFPAENPNPVLRIGDDLNIIYANRPAKKILKSMDIKQKRIPEKLEEKLRNSLTRSKNNYASLELRIKDSYYLFDIIRIEGHGYYNIYGKDITEEKKAQRLRIKSLQDRVQKLERKKIARELHDTVSQILYSSNLLSESLSRSWEKDPQKTLMDMKRIRQLNETALLEMRMILYELMPLKIYNERLESLVKDVVDDVLVQSGIETELEIKGSCDYSYRIKQQVYRIVQESINNIVKHSEAGKVKIFLNMYPKKLTLYITDNGKGFDTSDKIFKRNFGINIMKERAKVLGAVMKIESHPGKGTNISLIYPNKE